MNNLHRELAPISEAAWAGIEEEAARTLKRHLAARRVVDMVGPSGPGLSAVGTGHVLPIAPPGEGIQSLRREVKPLVELRVPFQLSRSAIDDVERGALDSDWSPVKEAMRKIAFAEDRAVFDGYAAAGIDGIRNLASNPAVPLSPGVKRYPDAVARAVGELRLAGVEGPYALILGADAYMAASGGSDDGYPVFHHIERIVDGFIGTAQTGLPGFALQMPGLNVRRIDEHSNQWTQELRLDGETEGGTRWLAGISGLASTFDSTTDITSLQLANGAYRGRIDTVNIALFGEVTVPLTERLDWIGGLRLSHERKEFEGTFRGRNGARAYFSENGDEDYTFATGRTGFTYALADNMTAFATVARGEKTGGYLFYNQFAAMGMPLTPYDSASTWSYEAGLKATDLGGFLTLGTSLFYNDTSDEQLFTFNPVLGRFSVLNADTRSYGLEIEAKAQATETMAFSANLALLDAEIDGGANPAIIGNDVPYAPVFTASLAADYRRELDLAGLSGSGFVRAEYLYTGSRQIDPANSRKLDGYGLVNLRAGWQKGNIDIYASVENLFDKRYVSSAFQAGTSTTGSAVFAGIPGEGRTFTLGARVKF